MKPLKKVKELLDKLSECDNPNEDIEFELRRQAKFSRAYRINCTGDVCAGDEIVFVRRRWGAYRLNGKTPFLCYQIVEGKVVKESYGRQMQQHTFTIETKDGMLRIKGRNLYAIGVWRRPWKDENARKKVLEEKHARGDKARMARLRRIAAKINDDFDVYI
ncbi:MAG: hypothetical protein D6712_21135 [Chloroflexi bacterium]|nr:MAG: hypothetical protein D6712_21135 [Chloroflexota bacterium]